MFNIKNLINKFLLALCLTAAASGAIAAPTSYHVAVDTTSLGGAGLISLGFGQTGNAGLVTATVSQLTGQVGAVTPTGAVTLSPSGFSIANTVTADGNFADIDALLGGLFSFDIAFSGNFLSETGLEVSSLYISLLDGGYQPLAGDAFTGIGAFSIAQGAGVSYRTPFANFITITANPEAVVPEPAALLLLLTGFGLMVVMVKRRQA